MQTECLQSYYRQKQSSRVPVKMCSEHMQQSFRRTPMEKCDFNKVAKERYWNQTFPWGFLLKIYCIWRTVFYCGLLLKISPAICFTMEIYLHGFTFKNNYIQEALLQGCVRLILGVLGNYAVLGKPSRLWSIIITALFFEM